LLLELVTKLEWTNDFSDDILKLISNLHDILFDNKTSETIITYKHPKHGLIYSYEIDGFNNSNIMDDSNIPSLLSLPYICPDDIPINHPIYQNTRKFILSSDNPWFFKGSALEGKYALIYFQ
jgi:meiotically up-regulated gene 157 (Mug157) protein